MTNVGSYTGAASPNGTFDQGGNVNERNEAMLGLNRGLRGGGFLNDAGSLAAATRSDDDATIELGDTGFRIASLAPAPRPHVPVPSLSPAGLLVMVSVLCVAGYRRSWRSLAARGSRE